MDNLTYTLTRTSMIELPEWQKQELEKNIKKLLRLLPEKIVPHVEIIVVEKNDDNTAALYKSTIDFTILGTFIRGIGTEKLPIAAVNVAIDDAKRKYRKFKNSRFKKQGNRITKHLEEPKERTVVDMNDFEEYGLSSDRITKEKYINYDIPMTIDEAIDQMESTGKEFFAFSLLNGSVCVVYKRKGYEGYGIVKG